MITMPHKLTTEQLDMFDYPLYTPMSTMYNLFSMMKFDKDMFELPKLVKALELSIKSHPALLTKFSFDEDGEIVQTYDPSLSTCPCGRRRVPHGEGPAGRGAEESFFFACGYAEMRQPLYSLFLLSCMDIFAGRHTVLLLEDSVKIGNVVKSALKCDVNDLLSRSQQ